MVYNDNPTHPAAPQEEATAEQPNETQAQLLQAQQQILYLKADIETMRRNAYREREAYAQREQQRLLSSLLGILDDLERAEEQIAHGQNDEVQKGLHMIIRQCTKIFSDAGVTLIDTAIAFDPSMHEAVGQEAHPEVASGTIIKTLQKGYRFKDHVLRPARVILAA